MAENKPEPIVHRTDANGKAWCGALYPAKLSPEIIEITCGFCRSEYEPGPSIVERLLAESARFWKDSKAARIETVK